MTRLAEVHLRHVLTVPTLANHVPIRVSAASTSALLIRAAVDLGESSLLRLESSLALGISATVLLLSQKLPLLGALSTLLAGHLALAVAVGAVLQSVKGHVDLIAVRVSTVVSELAEELSSLLVQVIGRLEVGVAWALLIRNLGSLRSSLLRLRCGRGGRGRSGHSY